MKIDRDTPCELYSWYETRRIIAERFVVFCLAFLRRLWRAAFGFRSVWWMLRGERVGFSISSQKLHMPSTFLCFRLAPSQFPLWISPLSFFFFFFLSMIHILLADGFVCFMPQREPSCTDLLPSSQFLELAWSSHPSRTTGPDEELQSLRLAAIRHGASVPRHLDRLPLLSSWVFLWNKGKLPEGGIHHSFGPGR